MTHSNRDDPHHGTRDPPSRTAGPPRPERAAATTRPPRGPPLILLPTLNEERGLRATLDALARVHDFPGGRTPDVLVVDGRSTDRTREVAGEHLTRFILQKGRGKGNAVREGLEWAVENGYGTVAVLDADATYPCDRLPAMIGLLATDADVVAGVRRPVQRSDASGTVLVHRIGNSLLNACAAELSGGPILDVCTGFWGVRVSALPVLDLQSNGFEVESELFVKSMRRGLRVVQIPVVYQPRVGEAKLHAVHDGARILLSILRHSATPRGAPHDFGRHRAPRPPAGPVRERRLARDLSTLLCSLQSSSFLVLSGSSRYPEAVEVARSVERCRPSVHITTGLLSPAAGIAAPRGPSARPSAHPDTVVVALPEPDAGSPSTPSALVSVPRAGRTICLETAAEGDDPPPTPRPRRLARLLHHGRNRRPGPLGILGAMLDASGFQRDVTLVAANASNGHLRFARVQRGIVARFGVHGFRGPHRSMRAVYRLFGSR